MKKKLTIIFFIFLLTASNSQNKNEKRKTHNPSSHIEQNLNNEKAIEYYFIGTEYYKAGDFDKAILNLKKALETEESSIIYNEIGIVYHAYKKFDKALIYFDKSIDFDENYYASYISKFITLATTSDFKNAEETLIKMLDNCKSEYWKAYANFQLSILYFKNKESCEKILKYYNKSKSIKEDSDIKQRFLKVENLILKNCG